MGYRDESGRVRELEEGGSGFAKRRGATGHATGMSSRELQRTGSLKVGERAERAMTGAGGDARKGADAGAKKTLIAAGDGKKPEEGEKRAAGRESLSTEVVAELCGAFCRDSGSDDKSTATEKFRHVLITNANDETIRFQHMRLGTHSGVCLSKVLKGHPLSTLDLFGNVIRDVGAIALLHLVRTQPTIKHLNLGSNDLSHEGGIAIARELGSLKLQSLELGADDNPLHANRFNSKVGVAMGEQLCHNTCLRMLGLNGTNLGKIDDKTLDPKQEAGASLRKALCLNETLEHLALSNNSLGTEGCVLILQGLAENATLKDLDVSMNKAGPELGVVAGLALSGKASLTSLSLAGNDLGPSGGCAMASALVLNTQLTSLNLHSTSLRDRGSIAIANALEDNRVLRTCHLSSNAITEFGGLAWSDTLWGNHSLTSLILSENPLGDEVAVHIAGMFDCVYGWYV